MKHHWSVLIGVLLFGVAALILSGGYFLERIIIYQDRPKVEARMMQMGEMAMAKFDCDGTKTTQVVVPGATISCTASKGF